jgi:hypothetical protein
MPPLAEIADVFTDAAITYAAASFRIVAAGAAALCGIVVASVAWLGYEELRRQRLTNARNVSRTTLHR